jgi:hypothetical protein
VHIRAVRVGNHVLVEVAAVDAVLMHVGHAGVPVEVATIVAHKDSAALVVALAERLVAGDNHFLVGRGDSRTLVALKVLPETDWGPGKSAGCLQVNHNVQSLVLGVHSLVADRQLVPCLEVESKGQRAVPVSEFAGFVVLQGEP